MKAKVVVRNVTLATLTAGLIPLGAVGLEPASAGQTPASLCQSTFGDSGPAGRSVVGEGPPGDLMTVTVGWDPGDWSEGLREVVTCVSVGGQTIPALTRLTLEPPNAGNIAVDLTLPIGAPGSLVCQQSILIGTGSTEGRTRSTEAVCFKLRAPEVPAVGRGTIGGLTPPAGRPGDEPVRIPNTHPAYPPAATTPVRIPNAHPATPPARSVAAAPVPVPAPARLRAPKAAPAAAAPKVSARPAPARAVAAAAAPTAKPGRAANELARSASPATVVSAGLPAADSAEAPRSGLPKTGLADRIPLAGAGGLLALGGAAIILGEPRRRTRRTA
jgi:hypothetical protein